jgi:hypothetical protein
MYFIKKLIRIFLHKGKMAINVSGMIQNMLHNGFTLTSCLSELIDNSLSANSERIRILIVGNDIYVSDDGDGMTKEELRLANVFHHRSEADHSKHGRFGIGGKQASVQLSDLQSVTIYSKKNEIIHMIELNYQMFISENQMSLHVSEIGMSSLPIWNKHSFDKGTLTVIHSTPIIIKQIKDLLQSKDKTNLLYHLGLSYHVLLEKCTLEIITEQTHVVKPIDVSLWGSSKQYTNIIHVYSNGDKYIYQYTGEEKGKKISVYRDFTTSKIGKQSLFKEKLPLVGKIEIRCAHRTDWRSVVAIPNPDCSQEEFDRLPRIYYLRNGKVIEGFSVKKKLVGDYHLRDTELDTRAMIDFTANRTIDKLVGIQVNKSDLKLDNMDPYLRATIDHVLKDAYNTFNKQIENRLTVRTENDRLHTTQIPSTPIQPPTSPDPIQPTLPVQPPTSPDPIQPTLPVQPPTSPAPIQPTLPVQPPTSPAPIQPTLPVQPPTSPDPIQPTLPVQPPTSPDPIQPTLPVQPPTSPSPIQPLQVTPPVTQIVFSKTDYNIMIHDKRTKNYYSIAYKGQFYKHLESLRETHAKIGDDRFIEYVTELVKLNRFVS